MHQDSTLAVGEQAQNTGLVWCDKKDRYAYKVTIYRDLVKVKLPRVASSPSDKNERSEPIFSNTANIVSDDVNQNGGGLRKPVRAFSRKSRKNLLENFASCNNEVTHFGTLTFPDECIDWSASEFKHALRLLRQRLQRAYPGIRLGWVIEWQDRKSGEHVGRLMPHFHFWFYEFSEPVPQTRQHIRETWFTIVNSGNVKHLAAGVQFDRAKTAKQVSRYVAKYASKGSVSLYDAITGELRHEGRFWAFAGDLDFSAWSESVLSLTEFIQFKRLVSSWMSSRGGRYAKRLHRADVNQGFAVFGLGADSDGRAAGRFASLVYSMLRHARMLAAASL